MQPALILLLGILLVVWLILTPPGLLGKADAIGYAVCHRIADTAMLSLVLTELMISSLCCVTSTRCPRDQSSKK